MVGRVRDISVWDRPPFAAGAQCYGYARADEWTSATWDSRLDARHEGQVIATLQGALREYAQIRRILVLHVAGGFRAFRIHTIREERTIGGAAQLSLQLRSLLFDFMDAGILVQRTTGGAPTLAILGSKTPQQWMQELVLPHMVREGYDWYSWNGSSSVDPISLSFPQATGLEVIDAIVTGRFDIDLNESTGQIGFVAGLRSGVVLTQQAGPSLQSTARTQSSTEQATAVVPLSSQGYSIASQSLMRGVVRFSPGVLLDNPALPLADNFGVSTFPVTAIADQFVDPTGARTWYWMNRNGRLMKILGSAPTVSGYSTFDLEDISSWDAFACELREGTEGTRVNVPALPARPLGISLIAGDILSLSDPLSGGDPVPTFEQHDCQAILSELVLTSTCSNIAATGVALEQDLTILDTSGIVPGHWGFLHNNVGTPWGLFGKPFDVVSVQSSTVLRVRSRYSYDRADLPFTPGAVSKQVRIYAERPQLLYIDLMDTSANALHLNAIPTVATTTDVVEYALTNGGQPVVALRDPSATDGVANRYKTFDVPPMVRNLLFDRNPFFTSGLIHWTTLAGSPTTSTATPFGPGTQYAVLGAGVTIASSAFKVRASDAGPSFSVRVRVRAWNVANWTGALTATVVVRTATGPTVALGTVQLEPPDHPSPSPTAVVLQPDQVLDIDFPNLDGFAGTAASYGPWTGFQVVITGLIEVGGVMPCPDPTLPAQGIFVKEAQQDLWNVGTVELGASSMPVVSYQADGIDWTRFLRYSNSVPLTGNIVQIADADGQIVFRERLSRIAYRASPDAEIDIDIANRRRDFADLLAAKLSQ